MVTASHNPAEYIGLKLSRAGAVPLSREEGIGEMEARILRGDLPGDAPRRGGLERADYATGYVEMVAAQARLRRRLKVVADAGNGMAGYEFPLVARRLDLDVVPLHFELDGTFPNHEANPLNVATLRELRAAVVAQKADFGVAFDGDADRAGFVDEEGGVVTNDLATALMAADVLAREKGPVVYDLRSSRALPEEIARHGGTQVRGRVGHSFMKKAMRERRCVFGGEYSRHYYWRENYDTASASLAVVAIGNILSASSRPMSALLRPLRRCLRTGEVNFRVVDREGMMRAVAAAFPGAEVDWLDGVTVTFPTWWCNVRPSNIEPLLRLNL